MRLPIVIAGVLVGAVLGVIVEVAVEQALEDTAVENIYFIPLLAMMIIGAWAGALIARLIPRRPVIKKQSFEHLPVCSVEFIKLVIKKMRCRKKVRRDVQAELAAHFEDELKECATDKERDEKAQQLIGDFGDVKLLGILLRRAKKRCRPLWRTVVAISSFQFFIYLYQKQLIKTKKFTFWLNPTILERPQTILRCIKRVLCV